MGEIKLAIVGVGNCASALVQGINYYETNPPVGLLSPKLGGYRVSDITPVCGFDVDKRKVGKTVTEAIQTDQICTKTFSSELDQFSAPVYSGPKEDGVSEHMTDESGFHPSSKGSVEVAGKLLDHNVDVLVNYLPVGSTVATRTYAEACINANVSLVNAIPEFIASDPDWARKFEEEGLPIIGDDIKSQIGATIVHRKLAELFEQRGVELTDTYQLNYGGNTDFRNMLSESRLKNKRISKREAVNSLLSQPLGDEHIRIGPSDYISWMDDTKRADIKLKGQMFGGIEVELTAELTVEDSPNSAGSAVNAIRAAKVALDRGVAGPLEGISALTMKHPPTNMTDQEARGKTQDFLKSENNN